MTYEDITRECNKKVQILNSQKNIYLQYMNDISFQEKRLESLSNFNELFPNNETLEASLLNKNIQEKSKSLFGTYLNAYFDSCIELRNTMFKTRNWNLYYVYIFLVLHTIEMTIKFLKVYNVKGFNNIPANHKIIKIIKDNENNFINLGISKELYDEYLFLLSKLDSYTTKDDLAVSFKYPLDGDFITPIITNNLLQIDETLIHQNVEDEKKILLISKLIYIIACISNYEDLNNILKNNLEEIKDATNEILNEINKNK